MKLIFKVFIVFILLTGVFASDVVRNGEGPAERNITFVYERLEKYIDTCLASPSCLHESKTEPTAFRDILVKIRSALPAEKLNREQLVFKSEKLNPGFFIIDGYEKIAITGDKVGDNIYINLDKIYSRDIRKKIRHLSLIDSIQLLIHELGHHQGFEDHIKLDTLGAKVSKYLETNVFEFFHTPFVFDYSVITLYVDSFSQSGEIVLNTGVDFVSLTHLFEKASCDNGRHPDVNPLISKAPQFFNIHWQLEKNTRLEGKKIINGTLALMCQYKVQGDYTEYFDFKIELQVSTINHLKAIKLEKAPKLKSFNSLYRILSGTFVDF